MNDNLNHYKTQLRHYLSLKGVPITTTEKPHRVKCLNPSHTDNTPSAVLYDDPSNPKYDGSDHIWCPICCTQWDIFDIAGLLSSTSDFKEQLADVKQVLGDFTETKKTTAQPKPDKKPLKLVPVDIERAREIFTKQAVEYSYKKYIIKNQASQAVFVDAWPYKNADSLVEIVDVRFEGGERKKDVISFYWNGEYLNSRGYPILIYNRDKLVGLPFDTLILIHEGAKKAAEAERVMPNFIHLAFNGGCAKIKLADWSVLNSYTSVYYYPDDDQQEDKQSGKLLPAHKQPGLKAAFELQEILPGLKICKPLPEARKIKSSGADIVEALQVKTPAEMEKYILECPKLTLKNMTEKPAQPPKQPIIKDEALGPEDEMPFRILGIGEDGRACFIDRSGLLQKYSLSSLSKNYLQTLASLDWWLDRFDNGKGKIYWDGAIDKLIDIAGKVDFDSDNIRGRGAWREKDGRICYHDGEKTIGDVDKKRVYIRQPKKEMYLDREDPDKSKMEKLRGVIGNMSFNHITDAVRLLSWTVLSPFAGGLNWRPGLILTGESGSGKSTVIDHIVKPIADPRFFSGEDTSPAGVRQDIKYDACSVVIDEAEKHREGFLSLMRQSTSDETGKAAKGTTDGRGMSFSLRSMFLLSAISPEVENIADDNRVFRVNMVTGKHTTDQWADIKKELLKLLDKEMAYAIRSMTWRNLKNIMDLAVELAPHIERIRGLNTRASYAEGLLLAAWFILWKGYVNLTHEQIAELIATFYKEQPIEEKRDEATEMLDKILDTPVQVWISGRCRTMQLMEIANALNSEKINNGGDHGDEPLKKVEAEEFKRVLAIYGLAVYKGALAISNRCEKLTKITGKSDYKRLLWRSKNTTERSENIKFFAGKQQRATIISGLFATDEEIPF
jgi:hypothetical protein